MRFVLRSVIGVAITLITIIVMISVWTRGDYTMARLVTDDLSLPSQTVNGVRLHLRVADGPEGAPTIIVLHGGPGGDFRSLQALDALSDQFRVVFYDQRGAGLSERVSSEMLTLRGHLEELRAVIDLVSPGAPPILIGHSWGAMLATAYLGQYPDEVRAAVLIEPGYLDEDGHAAWQARSRTYLSGFDYVKEAVLTGFRAQHVAGPDPAAQHDFLIGHMVGVFVNHPENPYHCGAGYTAPNWRFGGLSSETWDQSPKDHLARLTVEASRFSGPALLIAGACNDWIGEALQQEHLALFHNGDLRVIPEAGHDVIWDNPAASLDAIRRFLDTQNVR
ncbi:MAG: alpha/beta hydrolase [Yoonia sp.]|uniref:alpha/beta fold hydrolase n=1 Tax=Yoonia sp. TaxID=2212373 RepID=UPI00273E62C2|nr:alpha/beta hydrolase [Yoonia sp.]MDP5086892.1 alpha/beta hydrolase [Yoonia sp.]